MNDLISRQAAIDAIERNACNTQRAIDAVIGLPSAQPEKRTEERTETHGVCLDTISRQDAIDALDVLCQEHRYKIPGKVETYSQYNEAWQDALDRAEGAIGNLPSAQPERKTGKWIHDGCNFKGGVDWMHCSKCGHQDMWDATTRTPFCGWCGASMQEGEDNDS